MRHASDQFMDYPFIRESTRSDENKFKCVHFDLKTSTEINYVYHILNGHDFRSTEIKYSSTHY